MRTPRRDQLIKLAALFLVIVSAFAVRDLFAAWTDPTAHPTGDNTFPPINESSATQWKDGLFTLFGGLGVFSVFQFDDGAVPIQQGDVLISLDDAGNAQWAPTSTLGIIAEDSDINITIVTSNDPNNESCSVTCPADTLLVDGGCDAVYESPLQVDAPTAGGDGWRCETSPNISFGGYSGGLTCNALCAGDGGSGTLPVCADGEMLEYDGSDWVCIAAPQERVTESCPDGQAIKTINADGTVVCESISSGIGICTQGGRSYHEGAGCFVHWGASGFMMCSDPDPYTYAVCRSNGTWDTRTSCGDQSDPYQPFPNCGF